ncbi:MAG TPA: sulfatase [Gemmataceae bacterium]|nr:sulfatase [Gemmataceae bacterium]
MRLLSALALLVTALPAFAAEKMNVLFVVSDDLTNNALGCYGSPCKSPYIDRLAAKGVRFDRAYCQFPLCNPSRASFLTGLRPDNTGVLENATHFRKKTPDTQSLPQTFQKAGYYVARVGKLYHYGVPLGIGTDGLDDPPSWQHKVNPIGIDRTQLDKVFSLVPDQFGGVVSWWAAPGDDGEHTDAKGADETIKLLEANKDKPFFLACGFYRPHTPYVAPKKYFNRYPIESIKLSEVPKDHRQSAPAPAFGSSRKEQDAMTDYMRREAIQAYYGSTTFMDAQLGKLLDALEKLKLADKTIVVFFSDHGYHLGEHGLWQKMSLFENSARVPLVIYDPRAKGNGKASGRTVELVDLHATLAELCGLSAPKTDGTSLKTLLDDPAAKWDEPAYTQVTRGGGKKKGDPVMGRSVRTERYRYTEWDGGKRGAQLYDYQTDPKELKNLAEDAKYADVVKEMKGLLKR